ncbi:hypothetical protein QVD17_22050 [Tagetes erecta]|uniref:Uncharacterized protein n=1 Tax=Tagetes erecta TaxID=13708 RepID=A0AAD8KD22_TARER|nr:hypothetical protein QVD17_22050 [Tagetes erecta]
MDQHTNSPWFYDNSVPPPPFNYGGGGFTSYNHHNRRYQNNYHDEPTDSFGYANGTAFSGRRRPFSHGPIATEYFDDDRNNKLYVSSVPREVTEEDIRSLFGEYGIIIEVILFKELKTLQQQECCFVKFANIEDASQALKALHNQYTFPGSMRPIEVKYATKKPERPGFLKVLGNKVFVGSLNKHATRAQIAEVFSPYGYVEEIFLLFDEQKQPRGTGFITFSDKAMAADAINGLNGKYVMEGCDYPLIVRYADPKKPKFWENRPLPYFGDPMAQTSLPNSSQLSSASSICSVPACMEMEDPPECEWSEQICPDGNAYYYNCVTCESLWEKPEEYRYFEQQLENNNHLSNPTWVS